MKKITALKTVFVLAVALLVANVVVASGKIKVNLDAKNSETAVVEILNSEMSKIHVQIKDQYGETIYSKKKVAPAESFKTKYNFSNLEDGLYRFSVQIDNERTENRFSVENGDVNLIEVRKSVEPYFAYGQNKLDITFLNYQNEEIKMFVYDNRKNLLYEKSLGEDFAIHHAVDLSKLRFGDYDVVLANNEDIYEYSVSVK